MTIPRTIYTDRLPLALPDFSRRIWASPQARQVWEPRMQQVTQAWADIERWSVAAGVRQAALVSLSPDAFVAASLYAAEHGMQLLALGTVARTQEYSTSSTPPVAGAAWDYRAAYVRPQAAAAWGYAWQHNDADALGRLLGYPACCRAFFQRVWVDAQCVDTTWAMAQPEVDVGQRTVILECTPENNILLRWLGVRAVPHLPCTFQCPHTRALATNLLTLGGERGHADAMTWLREMLSWPVEWSGLHGIAEIRTPVVKVSARTDMTAGKYVVQVRGTTYPAEGARGIRFPYRTAAELRMQRIVPTPVTEVDTARYNGFTSTEAMDAAHQVLVQAAQDVAPPEDAVVLDLGCGDGTLLAKVGRYCHTSYLYGVELNPERVAAAPRTVTVLPGDFLQQPELWPGPYDIAYLMPGRLLEVDPVVAARCVSQLRVRAKRILVYAYGDWLTTGGLVGLADHVNGVLPFQVAVWLVGDGVQVGELLPVRREDGVYDT